jgi:hypothetical protein
MRDILLIAGLLLAMAVGGAHDDYCGLMSCYGTGHCRQNTCVFGVIVAQSATDYTLRVTKTLRGWDVAGRQIRIRTGGWREVYHGTDTPLTIGDAIVVTYWSKAPQPYQPRYLVRSATTDWRRMTVPNGSKTTHAEIDPFVRTGGKVPPLPWLAKLALLLDIRDVTLVAGVLLLALLALGGVGFFWWRRRVMHYNRK